VPRSFWKALHEQVPGPSSRTSVGSSRGGPSAPRRERRQGAEAFSPPRARGKGGEARSAKPSRTRTSRDRLRASSLGNELAGRRPRPPEGTGESKSSGSWKSSPTEARSGEVLPVRHAPVEEDLSFRRVEQRQEMQKRGLARAVAAPDTASVRLFAGRGRCSGGSPSGGIR
jgi:hypothetical protein